MTRRQLTGAAAFLKENDGYLIGTHRRPDGDTVGSAAALCRALRNLGKRAYVLENTQITPRFVPYLTPYQRPEGWEPEHVITVDVADKSMLSPNPECYEERVSLSLDHHKSNPGYAGINVVAPEYAACGELVYELLMEMDVPLDEEIAKCLYVAVSTDTGCFRYSNTNVHSHLVAAVCMNYSMDYATLNRQLFETKSHARVEIERRVLNTMEFFDDGQVALIVISHKDIQESGANFDDLDSISALPRQVEGVEAAITLIDLDNGKIKVSLRTNEYMDASAVCQRLGGGGHQRAAGAVIVGDLAEGKRQVLAAVRALYE